MRRWMRATTVKGRRIVVDSIDASYQDFKAFLQSRKSIGTPDWLKPESLREQALELERQRLLPSAQSLVLEFLTNRYARSIGCTRIEAGVQANGVEYDVVGYDAHSVHHFECENSAIGSRSMDTVRQFDVKAHHLSKAANRPVRQYYVTRRAAIQSPHGERFRNALLGAGVTILTYEDDLAKLIPKGSARDRLDSIFPGPENDPVIRLQEMLEAFDRGDSDGG